MANSFQSMMNVLKFLHFDGLNSSLLFSRTTPENLFSIRETYRDLREDEPKDEAETGLEIGPDAPDKL